MTGLTDVVFRRLAARFGAALVVTEMVASAAYVRQGVEAQLKAEGAGLHPHIVQLVGRDPASMAEAARIAEASGAHVIDLNFGCPAKRVTGGLAGSALMREPATATAIMTAVLAAVRVPVTVKMRLGWDGASLNAADLACRAAVLGVAGFTVHGRTRQQFYTGAADWSAIRTVVDATSRPVVANGDITGSRTARAALEASGAAAVMIGRASIGQPWLIGSVARSLDGRERSIPGLNERGAVAAEHYDGLLTLYGHDIGRRCARKHLAAYADCAAKAGFGLAEAERRELVVADEPARVLTLLGRLYDAPMRLAA